MCLINTFFDKLIKMYFKLKYNFVKKHFNLCKIKKKLLMTINIYVIC